MTEKRVSTMRAWRTHEYGPPLEAMKLDEIPIPEPGDGEVRVKVQAIPLNINDLERIKGGNKMVDPELPYSPGMEVMGVVDACGAGAEEWQGRRVVSIPTGAFGGYAEYAICQKASTFDMPEDIPLPDAAALYFPFHLAWLGLYDRAELLAGETVLIHAAAGGVGSAAIQLAVHAGATVIATVGSDEKRQLCQDLGASMTINYMEQDLTEPVLEFTEGKGVEVVFDNVGEAVMEKSMNCIAYNGRYVMMGFASDKRYADQKFIVPRRIAIGNFKLCGVMLGYADDAMTTQASLKLMKQKMGVNFASGALGTSINQAIIDLVRQKKISPVVAKSISFEDLPQAIDDMGNRKTVGRTVAVL